MDKVNISTSDVIEDKKIFLKEKFPEIFEDGKLDAEKLREIFGEVEVSNDEKFNFNWAGKSNVSNVIRESSRASLTVDEGSSVDFDKSENLLIEGDNLEVLKLLQKSYFNSVKMIYIDPPYNTGNGFVYNDNFKDNLKKYLVDSGQMSEDGEKFELDEERAGRNHSNWLNFMYPRLYLARNLLKEDGVIFISIDDNEVHHLKMICNEIFGEENTEIMIWDKVTGNSLAGSGKMKITHRFRKDHEYQLICYKNKSNTYFNKPLEKKKFKNDYGNIDNDFRGNWLSAETCKSEEKSIVGGKNYYELELPSGRKISRQWHVSKDKFAELNLDNRIYFGKTGDSTPRFKKFLNEKFPVTPISVLQNRGSTTDGNNNLDELNLKGLFENPKPLTLIKHFIQIGSNKDDIILDFFAGSGTTGQAVLELNKEDSGNRKFILVQYPEKTDEKSVANKEGYKNIFEITRERVKRAIEKYDLKDGFKVFKLIQSNYKVWNEEIVGDDKTERTRNLLEQIKEFESSLIDNYKNIDVLYEIILKEGFSLNSEISEVKINSNNFYLISDSNIESSFYLCLDKEVSNSCVEEISKSFIDKTFIFLDESLSNSDKQNLDKKINLRII
jgi:adenine-specific DNA-methyltransferase